MTELLRGVEEFNRAEFFECHDTFEAIWVGAVGHERQFLQGLIQTAVGYYHVCNGNPSGALSQWCKGEEKLAPFFPEFQSINVGRLLSETGPWRTRAKRLLMGEAEDVRNIELPKIEIIKERR